MRVFTQTLIASSALLSSFQVVFASSFDEVQVRSEDLLFHLEQNGASLNWTDDGTGLGGQWARIDEDDYDRAHESFLKEAYRHISGRTAHEMDVDATTDLVLKRQGTPDITEPVTDDEGKEREVNVFCRSGLGGNILRGMAPVAICDGIVQVVVAGSTGQWIWTPPRQQVPGSNRWYQIVVKIVITAAGTQVSNACSNIILWVVGESGCPYSAKRGIGARQNLDGGGLIKLEESVGSDNVIAEFDIGVRFFDD